MLIVAIIYSPHTRTVREWTLLFRHNINQTYNDQGSPEEGNCEDRVIVVSKQRIKCDNIKTFLSVRNDFLCHSLLFCPCKFTFNRFMGSFIPSDHNTDISFISAAVSLPWGDTIAYGDSKSDWRESLRVRPDIRVKEEVIDQIKWLLSGKEERHEWMDEQSVWPSSFLCTGDHDERWRWLSFLWNTL